MQKILRSGESDADSLWSPSQPGSSSSRFVMCARAASLRHCLRRPSHLSVGISSYLWHACSRFTGFTSEFVARDGASTARRVER